ncbi:MULTISPECIES: DUF3822 family protein [Reichenbachiella]|uniref:DUF3822 domain-containing protein n=1 Tax=Reichenbachiella agariperforans TaxID=156994 RepID=A0A1M6SQM2_REIAG|nr:MULTISPECIES: DUF3822 family protein [Reichenbachiella]SHK47042.1 Protein of unknown function [Reichenbachiella agariperforans]
METAKSTSYKLISRVKDNRFDVDKLHDYCLLLQIGIRDIQICVTDTKDNSCLLVEDFSLLDIKTVNARLKVLASLFENHHLLKAGFWDSIKLSLKSHKFSLVPTSHFIPESISEYLKLNCVVNPNVEGQYYYQHKSSNVVNAFASDKRLVNWIQSLYPAKEITILHQGSALIEAVLGQRAQEGKGVYCILDRNVLHVFVSQDNQLHYYNQFSIKSSQELLKYVMLVFKEFNLDQRTQPVVFWGTLSEKGESLVLLRKYIRNVSLGKKPSFLKFNYMFDEIPDHHHIDLFSMHLCD